MANTMYDTYFSTPHNNFMNQLQQFNACIDNINNTMALGHSNYHKNKHRRSKQWIKNYAETRREALKFQLGNMRERDAVQANCDFFDEVRNRNRDAVIRCRDLVKIAECNLLDCIMDGTIDSISTSRIGNGIYNTTLIEGASETARQFGNSMIHNDRQRQYIIDDLDSKDYWI